MGAAAAARAAAHRLPRLPRLRLRAQARRAAGVPLRGQPHAVALARDRRGARGPAGPLAGRVPRRARRDHPVERPTSRRCAPRSAPATTRRSWPRSTPAVAVDLQSLVSHERPVVTLPDAARGSAVAEYLQRARRPQGDAGDAPRRGPRDRHADALQPLRRGARLLGRRPQAVRDARQQRQRRAPVRPARAGDRAARGPPAAAAPPGLPRLADRPAQPRAVHRQRPRGARRGARASWRCCSSTSTTSRPSTTRSGTPSATSCWSRVADRLRSCVRPQDEIARLGGDEFAVCLHDADDAEAAAERVAERIMEAFQLPDRGRRRAALDPPQRRHRLRAARAPPTRTS